MVPFHTPLMLFGPQMLPQLWWSGLALTLAAAFAVLSWVHRWHRDWFAQRKAHARRRL